MMLILGSIVGPTDVATRFRASIAAVRAEWPGVALG
jgi:hypothetical protein